MSRKVVMRRNNGHHRFYCWGHDQWFSTRKLSYCFAKAEFCRFLLVPAADHHRKAEVLAAGQRVRAA